MSLMINLIATTDNPEFCTNSVKSLWTVSDVKNLKPETYDTVWHAFHSFRLTSTTTWTELLNLMNLKSEGQHTIIAYQYLLQAIVDLLIKDQH